MPRAEFPSAISQAGIAYHLSLLEAKVYEAAERAGVPAPQRVDLKAALTALPWPDRRRLALVLESVRVHADNPALHAAVHHLLALAAQTWANAPPHRDAAQDEPGADAPPQALL